MKSAIEDVMRKYGIARPCGCLPWRRLNRKPNRQILNILRFQPIIKIDTVNDANHKCEASVEKIMDVCDRFEELTILLDGFFSIHMRPYKREKETLIDLDKYVKVK